MSSLAQHLEDFFQERLQIILDALATAEVSRTSEETIWTIRNQRGLNKSLIYHLDKLVNLKFAEKTHSGRNVLAWTITGPANLPELIKNQITKLSQPVTTVEELEGLFLQQGEEIRKLRGENESLFELLDIVITSRDPATTTNPVILEIRGENTIEEIIAVLQTGRNNAVKKAFADFITELRKINGQYKGLKDQELKDLVCHLESLLASDGAKKISTARREIVSLSRHSTVPPSIETQVKMMEILIHFIHPLTNGVANNGNAK